jgi:hypothetical protein
MTDVLNLVEDGQPAFLGLAIPLSDAQQKAIEAQDKALAEAFAPLNPGLVAAARAELAGKNLACWCSKDDPYDGACHAAVLLEMANG